jgi:hypothetical protein
LNGSADYATGDYSKSRGFGRQKVKGEKVRRVTLSSFDDIANLIA